MNMQRIEMYAKYFTYLAEGKEVEEWLVRDPKCSYWRKWDGNIKLGIPSLHSLRLKPIEVVLYLNKTLVGETITVYSSFKKAKDAYGARIVGVEYEYVALKVTGTVGNVDNLTEE